MTECKWYKDEFCVNDACPLCADYCPVPNDPDVCKWEERDGEADENKSSICGRQYRKKPVEVEAIQWMGNNAEEVTEFMSTGQRLFSIKRPKVMIWTPEGIMTASIGDYIIKGVHGEFYPCKPDIFHKTYEEVTDEG